MGKYGFSRTQLQKLAALETTAVCEELDSQAKDDREPIAPAFREATPRQQALWKAVHHAKLQGVSLRGIARELGISRNTVRKYVHSLAPPRNRPARGLPKP